MSGILSSCCPFLTNATREGRGSPPYTSDSVRLRIHNWTNSLTGSTQVPRHVPASTEEKPGLPEMPADSSAIVFVKSETSFDQGEGEGECKIILPAREGCSEMDQAVAAAVAADFRPIPDGDWESEKGLEEEEVTLPQKRQAGDDELNITCLERKAAKTVLPLKPQVHRSTFDVSSALPFRSKASKHSSLPHIPEQTVEPVSLGAELTTTSPTTPEVALQETPEPANFTENSSASLGTPSDILTESLPPKLDTAPQLPLEDPTEASSYSELLDAISSLSAARGVGKSRRSRMTTTRAPTPWSAVDREEEVLVEKTEEDEELDLVTEEQKLERIDSSGSSSLFESVPATAESSYHTLPATASISMENADKINDLLPELEASDVTFGAPGDDRLPELVSVEVEMRGLVEEKMETETSAETAELPREVKEDMLTDTTSERTDEDAAEMAKETSEETTIEMAGNAIEGRGAEITREALEEATKEMIAETAAELTRETIKEAAAEIAGETIEGTAAEMILKTKAEVMERETIGRTITSPAAEMSILKEAVPVEEPTVEPPAEPPSKPTTESVVEPEEELGTKQGESAAEQATNTSPASALQPATRSAPAPAATPMSKLATEHGTGPVLVAEEASTEPASGKVAQLATKTAIASSKGPGSRIVVESAAKPGTEAAKEPLIGSLEESAAEPSTVPATKPETQITTDDLAEPAAEPSMEPVREPAEDGQVKPVLEPREEAEQEAVIEEVAEPDLEPVRDQATGPASEAAADTQVEPETEPILELTVIPMQEPMAEPTTGPMIQPPRTEPASDLDPATDTAVTTAIGAANETAAGDQPPSNIVTTADDVNLRYFCGAFRPVDHYMTRYAGLESTLTTPEPLVVPSGRSDSAVLPPGDGTVGRGRSAASDSLLSSGVRSSSPGLPADDDSGVRLEAKRSSTDIPRW